MHFIGEPHVRETFTQIGFRDTLPTLRGRNQYRLIAKTTQETDIGLLLLDYHAIDMFLKCLWIWWIFCLKWNSPRYLWCLPERKCAGCCGFCVRNDLFSSGILAVIINMRTPWTVFRKGNGWFTSWVRYEYVKQRIHTNKSYLQVPLKSSLLTLFDNLVGGRFQNAVQHCLLFKRFFALLISLYWVTIAFTFTYY